MLPPQNAVDFVMLTFLVHEVFTLFIKSMLKFQFSASGSRG